MNILFPMNGLGQRFSNEGYIEPKPIIRVGGVPLAVKVLKSFDFTAEDNIFIAYHRELKKYNFEHMIAALCPDLASQISFYCFPHDTKGAADTLIQSIEYFDLFNEGLLVADCDVIYDEPVLVSFRGLQQSAIGYSINTNPDPIYSYIKIDERGEVSEILEKIKISNNACCGLYYFCGSTVSILKKYYKHICGMTSEIYISNLYNKLIEEFSVLPVLFKNFHCVGTPIQLQSYCGESSNLAEGMRICFDLDNTLVSYPEEVGDYSTVKPIARNINILRELKNQGAYIIIYTARRMKTHNGNVSKLIADIGEVTFETLRNFDIPYDEICFGKPYAQFYIDDLAISGYNDIEKGLGIYFNRIESRSKHKITYRDGLCIKEGDVAGEKFWYSNIPVELFKYVPTIYASNKNVITMDEIKDIPLSHLYVRNSLSGDQMKALFDVIDEIHSVVPSPVNINANQNYLPKLMQRASSNVFVQNKNAAKALKECMDFFSDYRVPVKRVAVIHGDPVFSNIFCSFDDKFTFIDPRGRMGDELTIFGDIFYDYAKIYQSCVGYDFILLNRAIDKNVVSHAKLMFTDCFLEEFNSQDLEDVKMITKSLIVSLLPLHNPDKCDKFLELINNI